MTDVTSPDIGARLWSFLEASYSFATSSEVGSLASLVGAGLSLWVLLTVAEIRKRVLVRMRAPEAISDLQQRASAISNALPEWPSSLNTIEENIALANETLKNMKAKLTGTTKKTVTDAMRHITRFQRMSSLQKSRDAVRTVYVQLLVSAKAIENEVADMNEEP